LNVKKIIDVCCSDKWLKLLAIALAVVTWVYVSGKSYGTDRKIVRLHFRAPADYYILAEDWGKVTATVEGSAAEVRLLPKELTAEIDVIARKKGDIPKPFGAPLSLSIKLSSSDIRNLPPSLVVREFEPSRVSVTLDKMDEKLLLVDIDREKDLNVQLDEGLEIHEFYWSPKRLFVRGPKSVLAGMDSIHPKPTTLNNLAAGPFDTKRPLQTVAQNMDCLQPETPSVEVHIRVIDKRGKATIKNVRVEVRGFPEFEYSVFTEDKTKPFTEITGVEIRGPKKALEDPRVRAFIDLTDITDSKEKPEVKRTVQFAAEPGVDVLTKPPSVMVQIKARPTEPTRP
jgi:hypothetical protein